MKLLIGTYNAARLDFFPPNSLYLIGHGGCGGLLSK